MMNFNLGMTGIKAVLFDCDGTLVDSEYAHYMSFKTVFQELGHHLDLEDYLLYIGRSDKITAQLLVNTFGLRQDDFDLVFQKKRGNYFERCQMGIPPIEPTVNLLKYLAQEKTQLGIQLGVCSAARKVEVITHLHHLGVMDVLDVVLSGEEDLKGYDDPEGVNKPKPYIYLEAAKQLGICPEECIVIEDSIPGVQAGVAAGCLTIALPNEFTKQHDLSCAHLQLVYQDLKNFNDFFALVHSSWKIMKSAHP
jgi:beta-phosphoglucomutase-like phosphatase (HAD superfamily)